MSDTKSRYHCTYENCKSSFNRKWRLEVHLRIHTGERPFVCSYDDCDKTYIRASHLKRHEDTHDEGNFKCTFEGCNQVLKTKATLKKHLDYFHHKKKHKTYKCHYCDKEFNKHSWLSTHLFIHTKQKPIKCSVGGCEKRFVCPSKLKRHMIVHNGYVCSKPDCNRKFSKWSLYVEHFRVFHRQVHKCSTCDKEFSSAFNMRMHKKIHDVDRDVFACPMPNCARFYFVERNVKWHIKSYHEKRPFTCQHCYKCYKTEADLEHHQAIHDPNEHRRLHKKKKRKKSKPSLACKLAGCSVPDWIRNDLPNLQSNANQVEDNNVKKCHPAVIENSSGQIASEALGKMPHTSKDSSVMELSENMPLSSISSPIKNQYPIMEWKCIKLKHLQVKLDTCAVTKWIRTNSFESPKMNTVNQLEKNSMKKYSLPVKETSSNSKNGIVHEICNNYEDFNAAKSFKNLPHKSVSVNRQHHTAKKVKKNQGNSKLCFVTEENNYADNCIRSDPLEFASEEGGNVEKSNDSFVNENSLVLMESEIIHETSNNHAGISAVELQESDFSCSSIAPVESLYPAEKKQSEPKLLTAELDNCTVPVCVTSDMVEAYENSNANQVLGKSIEKSDAQLVKESSLDCLEKETTGEICSNCGECNCGEFIENNLTYSDIAVPFECGNVMSNKSAKRLQDYQRSIPLAACYKLLYATQWKALYV